MLEKEIRLNIEQNLVPGEKGQLSSHEMELNKCASLFAPAVILLYISLRKNVLSDVFSRLLLLLPQYHPPKPTQQSVR